MADKQKVMKILALVGLACALAGAVISALLVGKHMFPGLFTGDLGCKLDTGVDGCADLGASKYSKLLGIPIALFGLLYYFLLSSLFARAAVGTAEKEQNGLLNLLLSLGVFGAILDMTLGYINFVVLVHPCRLCAMSYAATAGALLVAVLLYFKNNKTVGSMDDIFLGLKASLLFLVAALLLTAAVPSGMYFALKMKYGSGGEKAMLMTQEKANEVLADFRSFKAANLENDVKTVSGDPNAYIVIHEFADFRCPHCYHMAHILHDLQKRWPGRIRIYYRFFPLDGTCNKKFGRKQPDSSSCNGAQAAICAAEQGIFTPMYGAIFDLLGEKASVSPERLQAITEKLGGNWSTLLNCMGSVKTVNAIDRDVILAEKLGLTGTPMVIVQDKIMLGGAIPREYAFQLIDALVLEKEGQAARDDFRKRASK